MNSILEALKWLFHNLYEIAGGAIDLAKRGTTMYLKGLVWLFFITVFSPLPLFALGLFLDVRWLIGVSGILWAIFLFALLVYSSPLGTLIETILNGVKGSGLRYVKAASGILLFELCFAFFGSILPIHQNLTTLPLLIIGAIILSLVNAWLFRREVVGLVVGLIFLGVILSFYFPLTVSNVGQKIADLDFYVAKPKLVRVSLQQIQQRSIEFFRPDGQPRYWYFVDRNRQIELFDHSGMHPVYRQQLKPITSDVVAYFEHQLLIADSLRVLADTQAAQKQAAVERARIAERRQRESTVATTREPARISNRPSPIKETRLSPGMAFNFRSKKVSGGINFQKYELNVQSIEVLERFNVQITLTIERQSSGTNRVRFLDPEDFTFLVDQGGTRFKFIRESDFPLELPSDIPFKFMLYFEPIPEQTESLFLSIRLAQAVDRGGGRFEPARSGTDFVIRNLNLQ